jgi:hypothetical protein
VDKNYWRHRLETMIATLQSISPSEFFDEQTLHYHGVEVEIDDLTRAFELDRRRLESVLATNPVARACWLPLDPNEVARMDVMEVYWRLRENYADERFIDGALEDPFETGALAAALLRIRDGLDELTVRSD